MFLWFVGTAIATVWFVFRDPRFDYRLLVVGSVLPLLDVLFGGARVMHTLVFSLVLLVGVMLATVGHRWRRRLWLGLPIATLLHLVFDGAWADSDVFWWPFGGWSFDGRHAPGGGAGMVERPARARRRRHPRVGVADGSPARSSPASRRRGAPDDCSPKPPERARRSWFTVGCAHPGPPRPHGAERRGPVAGSPRRPARRRRAGAGEGGCGPRRRGRRADLQPIAPGHGDGGVLRPAVRHRRAVDRARLRHVRGNRLHRPAVRGVGPLEGERLVGAGGRRVADARSASGCGAHASS